MKRRIILNLVGRGFGLTARELAEITECSVSYTSSILREYRHKNPEAEATLILRTEPSTNAIGY